MLPSNDKVLQNMLELQKQKQSRGLFSKIIDPLNTMGQESPQQEQSTKPPEQQGNNQMLKKGGQMALRAGGAALGHPALGNIAAGAFGSLF